VKPVTDPHSLAQPFVPRPDATYYLTIATEKDYDAVARMSAAANRSEVVFPLTAPSIRWLVDENPAGRGFVVLARARDDDRVVGHFVFYPRRLWVAGRLERVFVYVALFVEPDFRRAGVFSAMMRYGCDLVSRSGIALGYTVPNPRSAPGFLKFGNEIVGTVPFWGTPLGAASPLMRVAATPGRLATRNLSLRRSDRFDDEHARVVESAPPHGREVWGARSREELEWRFHQRPGVDYARWDVVDASGLVGYAVTRRLSIGGFETLVVCDSWARARRTAILPLLLDHVRSLPSRERPRLAIVLGTAAVTTRPAVLLAAGMLPVPQRLLPQPVALIGGAIADQHPPAWLKAGGLRRWHVTPYDWDVF